MSRSALIVGGYAACVFAAFGIGALRGDLDLYRIEGVSTAGRLALSPFVGCALGLAVVLVSRLSVRRFVWARALQRELRARIGPLSGREIALLAAASAIGEELLFRGALLPWLGLWAQALLFALPHAGPGLRFLPWTAWAFGMGVALGALFQWSGDLGGPIAAHFSVNYLNLRQIAAEDGPGCA